MGLLNFAAILIANRAGVASEGGDLWYGVVFRLKSTMGQPQPDLVIVLVNMH